MKWFDNIFNNAADIPLTATNLMAWKYLDNVRRGMQILRMRTKIKTRFFSSFEMYSFFLRNENKVAEKKNEIENGAGGINSNSNVACEM